MNTKGHPIGYCCFYFDKSRQGYYDRLRFNNQRSQAHLKIIEAVKQIREDLPKCGTRKLVYLLRQKGMKIGRDGLFELLRQEGLLIKRKRRYVTTTDSTRAMCDYDNLLKELDITQAEQVFVSDITFIRTLEGYCYLALVADSYTKKIMGKFVSTDLKTTLVLKALVESLRNRQYRSSLIHHSDHGNQYSSRLYTNALKLSDIMISMAGKGKAWENPVAERIMGILKGEFGLDQTYESRDEAMIRIDQAISKYNTLRPHLSCGYLTPEQAHDQGKNLKNVWRRKFSTYSQKEERKKEAKKERRKITTKTVKYI